MLSCLWDTDEADARITAEMIASASACDIEYRKVNGRMMFGLRVHDLIHKYCVIESSKFGGETQGWHETLVDGYWDRHVGNTGRRKKTRGKDGVKENGWWSDDVIDDSYIHLNLARHLNESGRAIELERLLLDYRWTMKQLEINRYLGLESDFNELLRWRMRTEEAVDRQLCHDVQALVSCSWAQLQMRLS